MSRLMSESLVTMRADGEIFYFLCTAEALRELAYGHLISSHRIQGVDMVAQIDINETDRLISLKTRFGLMAPLALPERLAGFYPLDSNIQLPVARLKDMAAETLDGKRSYGTHAVSIMLPGGELACFEDVGRHNAMDKAIGFAALQKADFSRCAILITGRVSTEMLLKAYAAGVTILATKRYPSDLAIELAKKGGITVVGQISTDRPEVYTWPDRLGADR
ncbi:MAG: formate dehydrogenase accessory sulfurtransferase FdhD [Eubacteriales bacterium]|nr:formate dehydrogenase accessory sulfurtransferase FdhD [Eubacteriales bacterium]